MAKTVTEAFKIFRANSVDLEPSETAKARTSWDFLQNQLRELFGKNSDLPNIKNYSLFGSFARRTKIRPLDDIDLPVVLDGSDISFSPGTYLFEQAPYLFTKNKDSPLKNFENKDGYISSIKVLNNIVSSLQRVSNYKKAEIKRNQEAAVLNLSSYTWTFDIVPAFEFKKFFDKQVSYYVIPDGKGGWMKTDPRVDAESINLLNEKYDKRFLSYLRLLKYWNNVDLNKPKLNSYYFEALVGMVFNGNSKEIKTVQEAILYFFKNCPRYLKSSCPDPKGYGPALDKNLESTTKTTLIEEMKDIVFLCEKAIYYEGKHRHREAILLWHIIFGQEFPLYG